MCHNIIRVKYNIDVFLSRNVLDYIEILHQMQNNVLMKTQRIDKINIQGIQLCFSFVRFS